MITVTISINGAPIYTRSARNTGEKDADDRTIYNVDTGEKIGHYRQDGAVKLARALLETIEEI